MAKDIKAMGSPLLPDRADSPQWIVCERGGQWATALRREPTASGIRIHETRSLTECWEALASRPSSFVVIELTAKNVDAVIKMLAALERGFPLARAAVVASRALAAYEGLMREARAVWFTASRRDTAAIAAVARRHLDTAPAPARTFVEEIWASLPWGGDRMPSPRNEQ